MTADLVHLLVGLSLLLAIVLPSLLHRWAISAPMVLLVIGVAVGFTPLPDGMPVDPSEHRAIIEHVTELAVIISLMGVGLALDRPLGLRDRASWAAWGSTWRMLVIAMPLTIAATAVLGALTGLGLAAAVLLGAVLAPTDPVLAADVRVGGPQTDDDEEQDEESELRFALTSEAGLNDGLAFPFVYLAVLLAAGGTTGLDLLGWFAVDGLGKVLLGVVVGMAVGRGLAMVAFRSATRSLRVAEAGESLTALAALITAYGLAEVLHGYGFLAVFACGVTFRSAERSHDYHAAMHEVTERLERLFTLILLLAIGVGLSRGLLDSLDWRGVLVGLVLILLIRPLSGRIALIRSQSDMDRSTKHAVAFFGVRGIGSIYYLAYAAGKAPELATDWMWATVAFTVTASVVIHGSLATPVLRRIGAL